MKKETILISGLGVISIVAIGGWLLTKSRLDSTIEQRDKARISEGHSLLLRAKLSGNLYPETLLYAAKAVGFEGQGVTEADTDVFPLLNKETSPTAFAEAQKWIEAHPGYRPVWSGDLGGPITGLSLSPHCQYLLSGGTEGSKLWDFSKTGTHHDLDSARSVAFHPGGEKFALAHKDGVSIRKDGEEIKKFDESVICLNYNLSGDYLVGAREDGTILSLGESNAIIGKVTGKASQLTFGPKDACLAVVVDGGLRLFYHHDRTSNNFWADYSGDVTSMTFHPDPMLGRLATGHEDGSIRIWKTSDASMISQISEQQKHGGAVTCLSYQSNGRRLVSGSIDGTLRLWKTEADLPVWDAILGGGSRAVSDVEFLSCGDLLVEGSEDGTVNIWSVKTDEKAEQLYQLVKQRWCVFDPDSQELKWEKSSGFLDLPSSSLLGAWQDGTQSEWATRFHENGDPLVASLLGFGREQIQGSFETAIESAIESQQRNLASLNSRRLKLLGFEAAEVEKIVNAGTGFINGEKAEMIWCKPGTFMMGEPNGPDFAKLHKVKISRGFWLGKHEVTQKVFASVMGHNPSKNKESGPEAPVENISWYEAVEFCSKLTEIEREKGIIPGGWEYALPTEAQWEYACRAGTGTKWGFGDEKSEIHKYANFNDKKGQHGTAHDASQDDGFSTTAPVGSFAPNHWSFHDMHGNVFEWCRDALDAEDWNYPEGENIDPWVKKGAWRTIRGGGYDAIPVECRSAYRDANTPLVPSHNLGLRLALVQTETADM